MSDLKDILSSRQLVKHHELIQYLTQKPNVKRTLAQLDYLLPSGASLQRFPREWLELMREGHSGSRNIEVLLPGEDDEDGEVGEASHRGRGGHEDTGFMEQTSLNPNIALICRQPVIKTIAELATLLESPATVPDTDGCTGLQTSQIKLPESLLRETQRRGLAYYFSEELQAKAAASMARGGGKASSGGGSDSAAAVAERGDAMLNAALTGGMGVPSVVARLPLGVRMRYKLLTQRGIKVQDEHCLPVRLHLGERLQITIDDENATRHCAASSSQQSSDATNAAPMIDVSFGFVSSVVKLQEEMEANPPLRIGVRRHRATAASAGQGPPISFTQVQISIEATRAERFRLVFRVTSKHNVAGAGAVALPPDGEKVESFLNYEVRGADVRQPGVLIGCERAPSSFTLPPAYLLADPAVHGAVPDPAADDAPARAARILPWWLSGSPLGSLVRDATYPLEESIRAAAAQVFTRQALTHESKLRAAKKLMKLRQEQEPASGGRDKYAKRQFRANYNLRNRHLIHFGLDASVPFVMPRK